MPQGWRVPCSAWRLARWWAPLSGGVNAAELGEGSASALNAKEPTARGRGVMGIQAKSQIATTDPAERGRAMADTPEVLLLAAMVVAGGLGAVTRFIVDGVVASRWHGSIPLGTFTINVTGSLLLGLVTGWALAAGAAEAWTLVLGTGFLGGYTTFSTAMVESARLIRAGRPREALGLLGVTWVGALAAAGVGVLLGAALA